ncbi:MAG: hypothetical protein AB1489_06650 [Acidobacteriota bacterium]
MRTIYVGIIIILILSASSYGQVQSRSVVLPESAAQELTQICSRPGPPEFEATWLPTAADVQVMEAQLSQISRLRTNGGVVGLHIRKPEKYFRQYVGIVVRGRRLIYINAICGDELSKSWQDSLEIICDGGCDWGVIYDTVTKKFSDLMINGIA